MSGATPPRLPDYLQHMAEAMVRIQRYVQGLSEDAFANDEKTQDAVLRNIEVPGEVARNIMQQHPQFAAAHPKVPWALLYGMRNRISHGYFSVDRGLVWVTIQRDMPALLKLVNALRA